MKRINALAALLSVIALLALPVAAAPELIGTGQIIVTASSAAMPVSLTTGTNVFCVRATIIGNKAARAGNTGDVYIGPLAANDTQPYKIATGEIHVMNAAAGTRFNLADWYLDVTTANDGLVIIYQAQ